MKTALLLVAAALVCVAAPSTWAQRYPSKPIRLIVTFPPGGGTDILARVIAPQVSESLGQPVVVDNRGGGGGTIGAEMTARATPDGYTFGAISDSPMTVNPSLYGNLQYQPLRDFVAVARVSHFPSYLVAHPSVPIKNVAELIAYAKANPGKLNYGSVGTGSVTHLSLELFKLETKVDLTHVPYKGDGPALTAVIVGEVQLTSISMVPTIPHVKAGRLRAIAVTTAKRSNLLPEVPTVSETVPGYEVVHWYGLWGPKGLPRDIVALWNKEVARVLQTEEMKSRMAGEGLEAAGGPPEQLLNTVRRDVEKWRRVVKEVKITVAD